jgi:hypothetical protein
LDGIIVQLKNGIAGRRKSESNQKEPHRHQGTLLLDFKSCNDTINLSVRNFKKHRQRLRTNVQVNSKTASSCSTTMSLPK